jgi:hypothetical protein
MSSIKILHIMWTFHIVMNLSLTSTTKCLDSIEFIFLNITEINLEVIRSLEHSLLCLLFSFALLQIHTACKFIGQQFFVVLTWRYVSNQVGICRPLDLPSPEGRMNGGGGGGGGHVPIHFFKGPKVSFLYKLMLL